MGRKKRLARGSQGAAFTTSLPVALRICAAAWLRSASLENGPISTRKFTPRGSTLTLCAMAGSCLRMPSATPLALVWLENVPACKCSPAAADVAGTVAYTGAGAAVGAGAGWATGEPSLYTLDSCTGARLATAAVVVAGGATVLQPASNKAAAAGAA